MYVLPNILIDYDETSLVTSSVYESCQRLCSFGSIRVKAYVTP